jgi:polysaccharide export outer membrane protein
MPGRWRRLQQRAAARLAGVLLLSGVASLPLSAQQPTEPVPPVPAGPLDTTEGWNQRLRELANRPNAGDYRLGAEDLLEVTVFEAPELNRSVRVSAGGEISLPLLGAVRAAGLTPAQLESVIEELLRRNFMKDPQVSVFVREMVSHGVSVFGAVRKPGVVQIRGSRSLLEVLSLAEGLDADAGDTVIVMRAAEGTPADESSEVVEVSLKHLLESGDTAHNVPVYPGDIVKVTRAGIVYVVGEVKKPGGFVLKGNENISLLQALALGEGLTSTAAKSKARIIRTDPQTGERTEIALDLGKVLAGKQPDPALQARDIVFVPNSTARSVLYRGSEAAVSIVSGLIIWRR